MKKHAADALTPWEHHHHEETLEHLHELNNHKTHYQHHEEDKHHEDKLHQENKPAICHSVQLNLKNQQPKNKQLQHKPNNIQQYLTKLEDKAVHEKLIEDKLHLHQDNKKIDLVVKHIAKNQMNIHLPEEKSTHPKVPFQRPIKHMNKNGKELAHQFEKHEVKDIKNQAEINIRLAKRKMSVDQLHKSSKTFLNPAKKSSEYEDLVIKKCYLKNINVYEEKEKPKKSETARTVKRTDNKHILDRLLSKFD